MSLGPYLLYIVRVTLYVWIRSGGFSSPRRMGEVQRDAPLFPSVLISKHTASVKTSPTWARKESPILGMRSVPLEYYDVVNR
jgi:hypothetical protein